MTLKFDNMLLKFLMYVRTMERSPTWKVEVEEPKTPTSRQRQRRSLGSVEEFQRLFLNSFQIRFMSSFSSFS